MAARTTGSWWRFNFKVSDRFLFPQRQSMATQRHCPAPGKRNLSATPPPKTQQDWTRTPKSHRGTGRNCHVDRIPCVIRFYVVLSFVLWGKKGSKGPLTTSVCRWVLDGGGRCMLPHGSWSKTSDLSWGSIWFRGLVMVSSFTDVWKVMNQSTQIDSFGDGKFCWLCNSGEDIACGSGCTSCPPCLWGWLW